MADWSERIGTFQRNPFSSTQDCEQGQAPARCYAGVRQLKSPIIPISETMLARNPEAPSNEPVTESLKPRVESSPEARESSSEFVGKREPRVPLPILSLGFAAVAAAIAAFLHLSRT